MNSVAFPSLRQAGLTLVLGLGETGLAAVRWCLRHGVALRIADTREAPAGLEALLDQAAGRPDIRLGSEALAATVLQGVTRVVLSPGLCPSDEPLAAFLAQARAQGTEIIGEIELFALALADLAQQGYQPKVLAVTGTNGKTTVTALARRLAEASGLQAVAAGNISPPALTALMEALDNDALPDLWVLELSSFQLESTHSLRSDAAVVLNLSQDHLDWHGSMQAYAAAKARLLAGAQVRIVNRDDALVMAMVEGLQLPEVRSFGRGQPEYEGDLGLEENHGIEWLSVVPLTEAEPMSAAARRKLKETPARPTGAAQRLMPVEALRLRGRHNALNALAALALVQAVGSGLAPMLHALREYGGEPHRCEFLRSVAGVDFVNDSKGTNVGATVAALEGMGRPVVLIAGGLGKGQDFSPLAQAVKRHAKAVVLIGQDAPLIRAALGEVFAAVSEAATMEEAVTAAMAQAAEGDVVLLSPACASMDMFQNYMQRGHRFAGAVDELAMDRGEVA
ncbi:MAG: UDP-N-acetylmuramoyl-L-alanine--D-glutamate ligase [Alcaligenaceae bacterium]|nr:UDP-N-acetylmuramoyl-L-alanine--D-glutamate ligase [Alcaligenaceae bacterium]